MEKVGTKVDTKVDSKDEITPVHSPMDSFSDKLDKNSVDLETKNLSEFLSNKHPAHPQNWPAWKRWSVLIFYSAMQAFVLWTSSAYGSLSSAVSEYFHVSTQVSMLNMSMNILGCGLGPIFLGPLSDIGGRKPVYLVSMVIYILFNISCAIPKNISQMIISHFIIGVAGSTALTNVAGSVADMFSEDGSGMGMGMFTWACSVSAVGSPIGAALYENPHMGWRWLYWLNMMVGGLFLLGLLFTPETLPTLIIRKYELAQGHSVEFIPKLTTKDAVRNIRFVVTMGFRIMLTEPVVIALGWYNAFAYGVGYFFLNAIWPVFAGVYKMSAMAASCTYLSNIVACLIIYLYQPIQEYIYQLDRKKHGGVGRPEARFKSAVWISLLFPAGMFLFAFTCSGGHPWIVPIIGMCMQAIPNSHNWLCCLTYLTDAYPVVAASAVAAYTLPSYAGATAFAHISIVMFDKLSPKWAVAILAFVSLLIPVLILCIYLFGKRLRDRSKLTGDKAIRYLPH
ncbi:high-affinity import carrier for pyridoxine [Schizosaccharomyces japonicus yFS275]|uniref:High-affinity import carrier for pyridoxine n=1 Tax=Schizosaccharomyces japonicus (strain yFS275 / FY16936) TaxID=402676 RepID=B6K4T9_SCHJY|nr:high-affinity import carrier for pyridoxine [Schizosaccharomyces japonicus yFS275]EEB08496.1 high-affinity import carrier for pyridoxine [Schizosaccharomyces japonicus yFS275]